MMASNEETATEPATAEPDQPEPIDDGGPEIEDTKAFLKGLLEALLFVCDRPITLKDLARAARLDRKRTGELLKELEAEYNGKGIELSEIAGGYLYRSNPQYSRYVRKLLEQRPVRLSRAQLETLAIVAYRQPITRPEVDEIRGVDCGPVLKGLLERDLIRILGKKDEPGRPLLYGTTIHFLELFSLQSLRQLPTLKEFSELTEDSKREFERETGEDAPEGSVREELEGTVAVDEHAEGDEDDDDAEDDADTADDQTPGTAADDEDDEHAEGDEDDDHAEDDADTADDQTPGTAADDEDDEHAEGDEDDEDEDDAEDAKD